MLHSKENISNAEITNFALNHEVYYITNTADLNDLEQKIFLKQLDPAQVHVVTTLPLVECFTLYASGVDFIKKISNINSLTPGSLSAVVEVINRVVKTELLEELKTKEILPKDICACILAYIRTQEIEWFKQLISINFVEACRKYSVSELVAEAAKQEQSENAGLYTKQQVLDMLTQYKNTINDNSAEITGLKAKLDTATSDYNNALAGKAAIESELSTVKQQLAGALNQISTLTTEAQNQPSVDTKPLEDQIAQLQQKVTEMTSTLGSKDQEIAKSQEQVKAVEKLYGELKANLDSVMLESNNKDMQIAEKDTQLMQKDELLVAKDAIIAEKDKLLAEKPAGDPEELENLRKEMQSQINDREIIISELEEDFKTVNISLNGANESLTKANAKITEYELQITDLKNSVQSLTTQLNEKESQIGDMSATDLMLLRQDLDITKATLNQKMEEYNALQDEMNKYKESIMSSSTAVTSDITQKYENQLRSAEENYKALRSLYDAKIKDIQLKTIEITELKATVARLNDEINTTGSLAIMPDVQSITGDLQESLDTKVEELRVANEELDKLKVELNITKESLAAKISSIEQLTKENEDLRLKLTSFDTTNKKLASGVIKLKEQMSSMSKVSDSDAIISKDELISLKSAVKKKSEELNNVDVKHKAELQAMEKKYKQELEARTSGFNSKMSEREDTINELRNELSAVTDDNNNLKLQIEELTKKPAAGSAADYEAQISDYEAAIAILESQQKGKQEVEENKIVHEGANIADLMPIISQNTLLNADCTLVIREVGENPYLEDFLIYFGAALSVALKAAKVRPCIIIEDPLDDEYRVERYKQLEFAVNEPIEPTSNPASLIGVTNSIEIFTFKDLYDIQTKKILVFVDRYKKSKGFVNRASALNFSILSQEDYIDYAPTAEVIGLCNLDTDTSIDLDRSFPALTSKQRIAFFSQNKFCANLITQLAELVIK